MKTLYAKCLQILLLIFFFSLAHAGVFAPSNPGSNDVDENTGLTNNGDEIFNSPTNPEVVQNNPSNIDFSDNPDLFKNFTVITDSTPTLTELNTINITFGPANNTTPVTNPITPDQHIPKAPNGTPDTREFIPPTILPSLTPAVKDIKTITENHAAIKILKIDAVAGLNGYLKLRTHRIRFKAGSAELLPQSYKVLNILSDILKKLGTKYYYRVAGYASADGAELYNLKLSEKRARTVELYLEKHGDLQADSVYSVGYGEVRPLYSDKTRAGRMKNRRVEIDIIPWVH